MSIPDNFPPPPEDDDAFGSGREAHDSEPFQPSVRLMRIMDALQYSLDWESISRIRSPKDKPYETCILRSLRRKGHVALASLLDHWWLQIVRDKFLCPLSAFVPEESLVATSSADGTWISQVFIATNEIEQRWGGEPHPRLSGTFYRLIVQRHDDEFIYLDNLLGTDDIWRPDNEWDDTRWVEFVISCISSVSVARHLVEKRNLADSHVCHLLCRAHSECNTPLEDYLCEVLATTVPSTATEYHNELRAIFLGYRNRRKLERQYGRIWLYRWIRYSSAPSDPPRLLYKKWLDEGRALFAENGWASWDED